MKYALGLDIGSESVGWSVVELNEDDDPIRLVDLGVRAFDAVQTERAQATTPAKERRLARSQRRRLRNRKRRLRALAELMQSHGLVRTRDELQRFLTTRNGDPSPWDLRVEGLDRLLGPAEWARVLFHIARHRGFKSTVRGEMETENAEERRRLGEMLKGMEGIHQGWYGRYRTVAEYLESPDWPHGERKRNKGGDYSCTISRADLIHEARTLFDAQRRFGNPHASEEMEERYIEILDEPPRLQEGEALRRLVGRCFLEPSEPRAPKATLTAQKFRALQTLVNQRLVDTETGEERPLSPDEIKTLLEEAFRVKSLTYQRALKAMNAPSGMLFRVRRLSKTSRGKRRGGEDANKHGAALIEDAFERLREAQKETLLELKDFHRLRSLLENRFPALWQRLVEDDDYFDEVACALTYYLRPDSTRAKLEELGIDGEAARVLADTSPFKGHANLSLKAMRALIPHLLEGRTYSDACALEGYDHSRRAASQKGGLIPPLDTFEDFVAITNPNVRRALTQARKVVNAVVREYGMPHRIGVELAREATLSPAKKREIEQEQLANRARREAIFKQIEEDAPGVKPERVWRKYELYQQQNGKCAYSLEQFDLRRVLTDDSYAEVDHIVPRSVCFDDSMANKVLVLARENRNKGDELAAVYVRRAHGEAHYERWRQWVEGSKLPPRKRKLLLTESLSEEHRRDMERRYLVATQYAARFFLRVLRESLAVPEQSIIPVSGRVTGDLRWLLGLGELKDRQASDTHHALDATICALVSHRTVQRMARYFRVRETAWKTPDGVWVDTRTGEVIDMPSLEPWPGFREELINRLGTIVVSRMPRHRLTGRGHKETILSLRHVRKALPDLPREGRLAIPNGAPRPTKRTRLDQLTPDQIKKILQEPSPILVDEAHNARLYALVRERLRATAGGDEKTWAQRAFGAGAEPLRMPTRDGRPGPIVRSIRLFTDTLSGLAVRHGIAENDTIVRLDIYRKVDGRGRARHYVVPVYAADVAVGWVPRKAATAAKPESEWPVMDDTHEFLFSLQPGDAFRVTRKADDFAPVLYMTSFDRGSVQIKGNLHDRSNRKPDGAIDPVRVAPMTALKVEKLYVDVLGRVSTVRREPHPTRHAPRARGDEHGGVADRRRDDGRETEAPPREPAPRG